MAKIEGLSRTLDQSAVGRSNHIYDNQVMLLHGKHRVRTSTNT